MSYCMGCMQSLSFILLYKKKRGGGAQGGARRGRKDQRSWDFRGGSGCVKMSATSRKCRHFCAPLFLSSFPSHPVLTLPHPTDILNIIMLSNTDIEMDGGSGYARMLALSKEAARLEGRIRHPVPSYPIRRQLANTIVGMLEDCSAASGGCMTCDDLHACRAFYDSHFCHQMEDENHARS